MSGVIPDRSRRLGAPCRRRRQWGLSLLELVVALMIFAVGAGIIAAGLPAVMGALGGDRPDVESYILEARGCAEELLAREDEDQLDFQGECSATEDHFAVWSDGSFDSDDIICDHQRLEFRCTAQKGGGWWVEILDAGGGTDHPIVLSID